MIHATKLQKFALEVSWKVALEAITINGILVDAHVAVSHPKYKHPLRVRTKSWIPEKVLKFAQQFSRSGKRLENRDIVWKNGKKSWVFFQSYNRCFISVLFFLLSFWSNLIQSRPYVCIVKTSFVFHLFDNLESGKRNDCFGKIKCGKSLECWIQISVRTLSIVNMANKRFCWWQGKAFMSVSVQWQVISSTTGNKNCVSNIADSDILGFLFLTLHTLSSGTATGFSLFLSIILGLNWYVRGISCVLTSDRLLTVDTMHALCSNTKLVKETMHKGKLLRTNTTWLKKFGLMLCLKGS